MQIKHIKQTVPMLFSPGHDWHLDIFIEAHAQITSVSLKAFSFVYPDNLYNINHFGAIENGNTTQLPIDVSKLKHSIPDEQVHIEYDITYVLL